MADEASQTGGDRNPAAPPPVAVEGRDQRSRVLGIVRSLPPRLRDAVVLYYLKECSQKEVAAFLALPVTTVNDRLLGIRRQIITDERSVRGGSETVDPFVEYPVARGIGRIKVIVGFEIVHNNEISRLEAPDQTLDSPSRIDLVHSPVVPGIPGEPAGIVADGAERLGAHILG